MYRSLLALLFAAVLLLGGCAAGRQTVPKEKSGQETNMDRAAFDRSDEEITYMDTTDNVIYLAGGCFWGMAKYSCLCPFCPACGAGRLFLS